MIVKVVKVLKYAFLVSVVTANFNINLLLAAISIALEMEP